MEPAGGAQIDALNREFSPSAEAVAHAETVLATFNAAVEEGRASTSVDGHMVDIPTARRAQRLLDRASAIARRDALTSA